MNKKQFLWFLLAMAVFLAVGFTGVNSALSAKERAASLAEQASSYAALFGGGSGVGYDFPDRPYMARVDVSGTIADSSATTALSSGSGYAHRATLDYVDALAEDENNLGILLFIDSPGGEIKASDELYLKLMDYKKATGRPIYCFFDGTACSGGYYVAMASDEICADRNCICVNIGVYISTYNMTGLFEKLGVEQIAFKSSENKGIGMTGLPWTEEQKAIYQSIVDIYYDQFLEIVAAGRHMTAEQVRAKDDGREMLAAQALEAGFIDSIGRWQDYKEDVLSRMGTDILYEYTPQEDPLWGFLKYFSSVMPRSDTQALLDFAQGHDRFVVMAYGG